MQNRNAQIKSGYQGKPDSMREMAERELGINKSPESYSPKARQKTNFFNPDNYTGTARGKR